MKRFRANGKLLLSGEYVVLDGGLALALPSRLGQSLEVFVKKIQADSVLNWTAYLDDNSVWFRAQISLNQLELIHNSNWKLANQLIEIFRVIQKLNPSFFSQKNISVNCTTRLEFPKNWGLGSSSTLLYLLAQLTEVNPYELSDLTFKSSGYDVACAQNNSPILYKLNSKQREVYSVPFRPNFTDQLYFVYLNKKQDTQKSVPNQYGKLTKSQTLIENISSITEQILHSRSLYEFERLIDQHEMILSNHMQIPRVKDLYFSDYEGEVKSLGAWGGDFVLITAREGFKEYFQEKGYSTILEYKELVL